MTFRVCVVCSIVLIVGLSQNAVALPRDATVVKTDSLTANHDAIDGVNTGRKFDIEQPTIENEPQIPGRVWCQHSGPEPAEEEICQGHCIPKGYSYGLCVSNVCSCI